MRGTLVIVWLTSLTLGFASPVPASRTEGATATVGDLRPTGPNSGPTIVVFGADADQRAELDRAVARFTANGLDLPDLEVHFFADEEGCGGHLGLFQQSPKPRRVYVCSGLPFVTTHELAHAWASHNLDELDRARFLEHRDLAVWDGASTPWMERGTEDAAFVIQQNLMAESAPRSSPVWAARIEAYAVLTGRASPLLD